MARQEMQPVCCSVTADQCLGECVAPGPDRCADVRFELLYLDARSWTVVAPDDEMNARELCIVNDRRCGRGPSIECARKYGVNFLANLRVVAIARDEHEGGHETVEAVETQEHANLRPLAQPQDAERGRKNLILVRLEELFARIGVECVGDGFPVIAVGYHAG